MWLNRGSYCGSCTFLLKTYTHIIWDVSWPSTCRPFVPSRGEVGEVDCTWCKRPPACQIGPLKFARSQLKFFLGWGFLTSLQSLAIHQPFRHRRSNRQWKSDKSIWEHGYWSGYCSKCNSSESRLVWKERPIRKITPNGEIWKYRAS